MAKKKEKDWFKLKRYPHIGLPLNPNDRYKWIEPYVTSELKVAKHSFLPFIHKTSRVRKFRKAYKDHIDLHKAHVLQNDLNERVYKGSEELPQTWRGK